MTLKVAFLALASLLPAALAQQGAYAQCGGVSWTGGTTCVSGYVCTYSNDYYSQCLPGTASSSTATSATTTTSSAGSSPTSSKNYWFSFGDSYTQTGFNISSTAPASGNPLGNPAYPGYTAVGGVNWIDQATTVSNHSVVLTYNFAYGGATIDANLVTPYESTVLSLTDQVNEFLNANGLGTGNKIWASANTLFSVWIGINDIGNSYGNSGSRTAFDDTLLNAYFALIEKLYNAGGRNFLFINVPPIDRSPLMLAQSSSAQAAEKAVIADFNSKLITRAANLTSTYSGVKTYAFDANSAFTTYLNSPTSYGFVDATSYGNTGDFWGNNYHPSPAVHVLLGNSIGNSVLSGTVW
ncbi:carbohydrate esterase family 16 protein [Auriscalpium vulgare]|uniref:Carbohydrate esterase family 16 protein n=1 Tax=Auriscalpium vulgare TaxID=40419 RepID=A0ACB8RQL5_9AGAM|nr:carbohydrate esterase family 16 protein [Auriscalpium vulgare]